jgi:hypothetical protein
VDKIHLSAKRLYWLKNFTQIKANYLKFLLLSSYSFFNVLCVSAQNSTNNLTLAANSVNFSLTTYAHLENEQSIANALTVSVKSASNTYRMYVRVSAVSTGNTIPVSKLAIQLTSSTVTANTFPATGKISLSTTDQQISSNNKKFSGTDSYTYKLFLGAIGYDYPPGTYTFTILFSMTQP